MSGTKTALMERLRPFQECSSNAVPNFGEITTVTFPVTPTSTLSSYQSQSSTSMLSNGFYHFGSTSSTPPISPASSDLSVCGSLPDTFNDGPMSSPQFGLQPSPVHGSAEESLMSSMNGGSIQLELEGIDTEKDKMLVEKQKVINELTWKLQQEQRQVEELRMQLQKRKRSNGLEEKQQTTQHFFGVPIKQENAVSSCPFASKQTALKGQASSSDKLSNCGVPQLPHIVNSHCLEPAGQSTITSSTFLSPQCSPQHSPLGATKSPQHISLPPSPNSHYLLSVSPSSQAEGRSRSPQTNSCLRTASVSGEHPRRHRGGERAGVCGQSVKHPSLSPFLSDRDCWHPGWAPRGLWQHAGLPGKAESIPDGQWVGSWWHHRVLCRASPGEPCCHRTQLPWGATAQLPCPMEPYLAQLLLPWGSPGTAPLFPKGPQHSSLPLGEHWQSSLCPGRVLAEHPLPRGALAQLPLPWGDLAQLPLPLVKHWHSSLCPWRSPGTAPSALGEHWHSFFCPKRALTQLPLPSGGGPGTACCAPGGVLAQLPLPHGALAQLCPQRGSTGTDPSAPGRALAQFLQPWESPAAVLQGFSASC